MKIVDAHSHAYDYSKNELEKLEKDFIIISVSEDYSTSKKSIELSKIYRNIIPVVGIHPWIPHRINVKDELRKIEELIKRTSIKIIGEIGLDKTRFRKTLDVQLKVFEELLKTAADYDLAVNIHSAGTAGKIFQLLLKYDIKKAYFHWYTGSIPLMKQIESVGYFIGINVVFEDSKNNFEAAKNVNLRNVLFESDGPYKTRGIRLSTFMLKNTIEKFAELRGIKPEKAIKISYKNLMRYLK
ncbi:MAG: TatD family hydrolase [Candidatus Aenigmarchaeota archaeon]|nr:TatD family hydrolase [Candidatus Aenigmarchaeota archaeon]